MELFAKECCEAEKYDLKKGLNKSMGRLHQALNSMKCDALNKASSLCQKLRENIPKENSILAVSCSLLIKCLKISGTYGEHLC